MMNSSAQALPGLLANRAVCFLDVLGFRQLLETMPLSELAAKYDALIGRADEFNRPQPFNGDITALLSARPSSAALCSKFVFSDSIILVSLDESWESVLQLLTYSWRLLQASLVYGMPFRGGIAFGQLYVDSVKSIFLGKALSAAYELEQSQDWIGVAIDPSLEAAFPRTLSSAALSNAALGCILRRHAIPFKGAERPEHLTLNWRFNLIVKRGTRSLFGDPTEAGAQLKIRNTLAYAADVVASGHAYGTTDIPVELRTMWVGDKEPPFPHGDNL